MAEVLITLGIIGVVAAITIPTIINKTQDMDFKSILKKTYADINNAYTLANQEEKILTVDTWEVNAKTYYEIFSRLNTTSFCIKDYLEEHSCNGDINYSLHVPCTSFNGDAETCFYDGSGGYALLTNGVRINAMRVWNKPGFVIDVNGKKKPNVVGRDIFVIFIRGKIIPAGAPGYEGRGCDKNIASINGAYDTYRKSGGSCAYKYLYE